MYRDKRGKGPGKGLLRGGSYSILPGSRWPEGELATTNPVMPGLEAKIAESEEKHGRRRKSSGRIYRVAERLFFLGMVIFMLLAFRRFFSAVAPAFFG